MTVKMDRMRSRYVRFLDRGVGQVLAIHHKVHIAGREVVLPHCVERIVDVRRVLGVQDGWVTVVEEQRRVEKVPSERPMRDSRIEVSSEGEVG